MRVMILCVLTGILAATVVSGGPEKAKTLRVIVLIDGKTKGLAEGAKIKEIQLPKNSVGKRTINDAKTKDRPRLNGQYVVKTCNVILADGKALRGQEVLVAIEVDGEALRDFRYVETCQAQSDRGRGRWYAYTAVGQLPGSDE
jgi:hypothetical protein